MARGFFAKLATGVIGVVLLCGGALVIWNLFGQSKYGGECSMALGCRSFMCVHHDVVGTGDNAGQWETEHGRCTMSCSTDAECGSGARCVVLTDATRDDLPPFGKPDRACLRVGDTDDHH